LIPSELEAMNPSTMLGVSLDFARNGELVEPLRFSKDKKGYH
jgi:hypothetical protein